jgi:hypothetical protein
MNMNDKERHEMLERFLYLHEFALHPNGRTHEGWMQAKENAEIEALEFARPILLEMIRAYAEQEIAGIGCVCGCAESVPVSSRDVPGETLSREEWYYKGIEYARENLPMEPDQEVGACSHLPTIPMPQDQEALEESCNAYQDSQFLGHVHAMKCALFIDIRDTFVKEIQEHLGTTVYDTNVLRKMTPDMGFYSLITTGSNLILRLDVDDDYGLTVNVIEQALIRMFEEVQDG